METYLENETVNVLGGINIGPDRQWSIHWVDFPPPAKCRPALIISSDRYSDGVTLTVIPFTTQPFKGNWYDRLWFPVNMESDIVSWCKINNITTVHRDCIRSLIGYLRPEYRPMIMERIMAYFTGADVSRAIPEGYRENTEETVIPEPESTTHEHQAFEPTHEVVSEPVTEPGTIPTNEPVHTVFVHKPVHPLTGIVPDEDPAITALREMILDKDLNLGPVYKYLVSKRLVVSKIPKENLLLTLVGIIRDHGYRGVRIHHTTRMRYEAIIARMIDEKLTTEAMVSRVDQLLSTEFREPVRFV